MKIPFLDKYRNPLSWLAIIGLIFIFLGISTVFSINIPNSDDYKQLFHFSLNYLESTTFFEKLSLVFEQKNEHRIAALRFFTLLDWSIFGKVNFTHSIFAGNVSFVFCFFLLWRYFHKKNTEIIYLLPVALLFFVPVFEINSWSAAGFPYNFVTLFILLTPFLLQKDSKTFFILAILSAVLATFTFGNGFIAFLIAYPVLIFRKKKRQTAIWTVAFLLVMALYFWGYSFRSGEHGVLDALLSRPHYMIINFILFFGALFKGIYADHHLWGLLFGVSILGLSIILVYKNRGFFAKHPVLLSWLLFPLLSAAIVAITRSSFGLGATTTYRYRTFQVVFYSTLLISWLMIHPERFKRFFAITLFFSVFLFTTRLQDNLERLDDQHSSLVSGMQLYMTNGDHSMLCHTRPELAANLLKQCLDAELYQPPEHLLSPIATVCDIRGVPKDMRVVIEEQEDSPELLLIKGWAFLENKLNEDLQIKYFLKSGNEVFCFDAGPNISSDNIGVQNELGFSIVFVKTQLSLPRGEYQLGMAIEKPMKGIQSIRYLKNTITIQ